MVEETPRPETAFAAQPSYTQDELRDLDNFLATYPGQRRLLRYLYDHHDEAHTAESVKQKSGLEVGFLELKTLMVYKLLEARDESGQVVKFPFRLAPTARFHLRPEKKELIEAVLARKKWLGSL